MTGVWWFTMGLLVGIWLEARGARKQLERALARREEQDREAAEGRGGAKT